MNVQIYRTPAQSTSQRETDRKGERGKEGEGKLLANRPGENDRVKRPSRSPSGYFLTNFTL